MTPVAIYRADGTCVLADPTAPAVLRAEAPPALREHFERAVRGERVRTHVAIPGLGDGEPIAVTLIPLRGRTAGAGPGPDDHVAVVFGADESELVRQLVREAEDARRLRDEFLSTASHELRTPLQAIL